MSQNNAQLTSGDVFVRHFFLGVISIAVAIVAIKFYLVFGANQSTPLITAGFIFIINLITVGSFTYKIITNDQLLAEEDSPDHAYYLGFCLTLAALALIFFSDAIANQNTVDLKEKSDLIRGALTQFAAGLLATLLGLNARIYIASKQNRNQTEPTELLTQLRKDVSDFSSEIAISKQEHISLISDSIKKLTQSLMKMEKGAENLSATFAQVSTDLSDSLSAKSITEQTTNFLDALKELSSETSNQSQNFTDNLKELSGNTSALTDDLAKTTVQLNNINNSISTFSEHLLQVSNNDLPKVSASTGNLISSLNNATSSIGNTASSVSSQIILLNQSIDATKDSINKMGSNFQDVEITQLKDDVTSLSKIVGKLTGDISNLSVKIYDATYNLPKVSASTQTFISGLENVNSTIGNSASSAEKQINSLNQSIDVMSSNFQKVEITQLKDDVASLSKVIEKLATDISNLSVRIEAANLGLTS